MKKLCITALSLCLALALMGGAIVASADTPTKEGDAALTVQARSAVLMDYDTGTVVFAQSERQRVPIASMVKIMTLLLTMEEIDAGNLSADETVRASEYAASMGGSQAFLDAGSDYCVRELIKSIVVGSANDACVALAERIAGSTETFVARMNERARDLGMEDTCFANCTGLPGGEQYCCALDAAKMMRALAAHPAFYDYAKIWMFDFVHPSGRITQLSNTNKLLRAYEGCDGGKTGFTNDAKYCLSATAKRGNTRLISVVCGAESSKIRNAQNAKLFNYGFAHYETRTLAGADAPLEGEYKVDGGKEKSIQVIPAKDVRVFMRKGTSDTAEVKLELLPLKAPIAKGETVGNLTVWHDGEKCGEVSLLSANDVHKYGYTDLVDDFIAAW